MSAQQKNTAICAGVGFGGGAVGTVDASVIGGRIRHELDKSSGCTSPRTGPGFLPAAGRRTPLPRFSSNCSGAANN
jgi:hypothetical protein